ncbi:MAG: hypothetical protein QGF77_05055, partial [Candidatus Thalassarchaeaceae archaeon]|nr:hypothetical protein [Candidatus Thalassarchaeaceae archaeon]
VFNTRIVTIKKIKGINERSVTIANPNITNINSNNSPNTGNSDLERDSIIKITDGIDNTTNDKMTGGFGLW